MIHVRINAHHVNNATLKHYARDRLSAPARKGVVSALEILATEMRSRAPVDTGALRDSIEVVPPGAKSASGEVIVGGNGSQGETYYAMFLEFGTVLMPARPFMRPAADAASQRIARTLAASLREVPAASVSGD